jgi:ribonuclease P protein component
MNDAVKKLSINFNFSFLVIAKSTMLNSEFKNIKETLFQEFKKIK